MSQDPDTLIAAMIELDALLVAEDAALRSFDVAAIATAAERKIELAEALATAAQTLAEAPPEPSPWTPTLRERLAAVHGSVRVRARANGRRLHASLRAVRALVDHLTGTSRDGYGRDRAATTTARPVLACDIG